MSLKQQLGSNEFEIAAVKNNEFETADVRNNEFETSAVRSNEFETAAVRNSQAGQVTIAGFTICRTNSPFY